MKIRSQLQLDPKWFSKSASNKNIHNIKNFGNKIFLVAPWIINK